MIAYIEYWVDRVGTYPAIGQMHADLLVDNKLVKTWKVGLPPAPWETLVAQADEWNSQNPSA